MTAENSSRVSQSQLLVGQLLTDQTALSALLEPGGAVGRKTLLMRCRRTIREFDPEEKGMFMNLLLAAVTNVPEEKVKKGALVLFKIPDLAVVSPQSIARALDEAVQRLVGKDSVTRLERDLVKEALYHTSSLLTSSERAKLSERLSEVKVKISVEQQEENAPEVPSSTPHPKRAKVARYKEADRQQRRDEILGAYDGGATPSELAEQHGIAASTVEDIISHSGRKLPGQKGHLRAVPEENPRESRKREVDALRDQCAGMTPEEIEATVIKLRSEGYFKNFEIERISGYSEGEFRTLITNLLSEGKIQSKKKK